MMHPRFLFFLLFAATAVSAPGSSHCQTAVSDLQLRLALDGSRAAPRVAAHRGASAIAPENTHAAIARAIDAGADLIEFDVRATSDGELLLFHDETLERFGGGKKKFAQLTAEAARQLDVGSFFDASFAAERPPSLAEAVQQCLAGNSIPLIEHKTGSAEAYSAVLRELDAVDQVIVQSFNWKFLAALRAIEPEIKLGALGSKEVDAAKLAEIASIQPVMVGWKDSDITPPAIAAFHQAEYAIAIWTVNDPRRMRALAKSGIDIIITDQPAKARQTMNKEP